VTKIGAFQEMRSLSRRPYFAFVAPSSILNPAARTWSHTIGGSRLSKTVAASSPNGARRPYPPSRIRIGGSLAMTRLDWSGSCAGGRSWRSLKARPWLRAKLGWQRVYRRHNKPVLGPLGDSLEDLS